MMCEYDFPGGVPKLLPEILTLLNSQNHTKEVYAGLKGLLALASSFEYEMEDEERIRLYKVSS